MDNGQRPQTLPQTTRRGSPTPSPPALDTVESETKLSRKREREVSLEPATPSAEIDIIPRDRKDSRTPAKKNRRYLSTTVEEEDSGTRSRSNSVTPPMSVSPPQEMKIKVRQISQGVEDLNWRNMLPPHDQRDEQMSAEDNDVGQDVGQDEDQELDAGCSHTNEPSQGGGQPDKEEVIPVPTTHDIVSDDSSPPKTPDSLQMSQSAPNTIQTQLVAEDSQQGVVSGSGGDVATQVAAPVSSRLRGFSESGEKGVKRKFLERGTSQGPPEAAEEPRQPSSEALKRPRDEADWDDNPREGKRISPPPEPKSPGRTSPPSPKVPKLGGFMAYASASSPFASVKGKNLFASSKTPSKTSSKTSSLASTPSSAPAIGFGAKLGESSTKAAVPVRSGFDAFSGASSPFASVTRSKSPPLQPTSRSASPPKRSGFEAFGGNASPFASVTRAKSPTHGSSSRLGRARSPPRTFASSPFGSYATGMQGFSMATAKRTGATSPSSSSRSSVERAPTVAVFGNDDSGGDDSDDKPTTFGERLRAGKDDGGHNGEDEQKVTLTEQDVTTGEEDEETLMHVRGKLFALQDGTQWKERGTGILKINVKRHDGSCPRLVMRKEAVYTLLLNVTLFPGMRCTLAQDPRYLRFSVIEDGKATHYNLRVANAKIAQEFLDELNANIPSA